jgi:uncharacterized membrane protein
MPRQQQFPEAKVHETNIETVIRLEAEQENRVAPADRLSEAIGQFAGTNTFITIQLICVALWVFINTGAPKAVPPFDPFPFVFLGVLLALEAVLLTSFVLIRQNRMSAKSDHRSHLDLQINLLAEKEITKVIQLLQRMSQQMGIEQEITDRETRELGKDTELEDVARDLQENLK